MAMSSPVALMCGAAVIMAGLAFFTTDEPEERPVLTTVAAPERADRPAKPVRTEKPATVKPRVERVPRRDAVYVSVYNNSNISGLAASTASRRSTVSCRSVTLSSSSARGPSSSTTSAPGSPIGARDMPRVT